VKVSRGYLVPLTKARIELSIVAMGSRDGSSVSIWDPKRVLFARDLRAGESTTITLNDRNSPGPWLFDTFSDRAAYVRIAINSNVPEPLLFGAKLKNVELIRSKLGR
jgi:hypothetical protein